jgi:hypothetical protein
MRRKLADGWHKSKYRRHKWPNHRHRSADRLHNSAAALHRSKNTLHKSADRLHRSAATPHQPANRPHNLADSPHGIMAPLHSQKNQQTRWPHNPLNPNSAIGEHARLGRSRRRPRRRRLRVTLTWMLEICRCARVFREGAENCARGGRAPNPVSECGFIAGRAASGGAHR